MEDIDPVNLRLEADRLRRIASGSLCLLSLSLLPLVLLIPGLFTYTRIVQSIIEQESNECADRILRFYILTEKESNGGSDFLERNIRSVAHAAAVRKRLHQAINYHRQVRYLQQKLAETATLLNSSQAWEETTKADELELGNNGLDKMRRTMTNNQEGDPDGNSFEFSSSEQREQDQYLREQQQDEGFYFSTSFPIPFGGSSSSSHLTEANNKDNKATTAEPSVENKFLQMQQSSVGKTEESREDDCSCICSQGVPGPQGTPGPDGMPGVDGRPGRNGPNEEDAIGHRNPSPAEDICISCPQGMAGGAGPPGPKGVSGTRGCPGEDGANGRRGSAGGQGPIGCKGPPGKPGAKGPQGRRGRTILTEGSEGPTGNPGPTGAPGPPGKPGKRGKAERGCPGRIGEPGLDGKNGSKGAEGRQGNPGKQGIPGGCGHCGEPRTGPGY